MADLRSSRDEEGEERGGWAHDENSRGDQGRAREWEEAERQSREVKLGLHPLQTRYVLWYTRRQRQPPGQRSATSYEDSIRRIADFSTVRGCRKGVVGRASTQKDLPSVCVAPSHLHCPASTPSLPIIPLRIHSPPCASTTPSTRPPSIGGGVLGVLLPHGAPIRAARPHGRARLQRRHPPALGGEPPSSPLSPRATVQSVAPLPCTVCPHGRARLQIRHPPALGGEQPPPFTPSLIFPSSSAPSSPSQQPAAYPCHSALPFLLPLSPIRASLPPTPLPPVAGRAQPAGGQVDGAPEKAPHCTHVGAPRQAFPCVLPPPPLPTLLCLFLFPSKLMATLVLLVPLFLPQLMAVVGEQLEGAEEVCGVVLSVRFGEDILSIWNRSAPHSLARDRLCESIRKHLGLPPSYTMEYKPHDASLKDHSSYRNTWVRT
ncbi:unnamed protein product [Closterium sp. NIES-54]